MHVVINGWFAGALSSGSGQYIDHMLRQLPQLSADARFTLLVPDRGVCADSYLGVAVATYRVPPLPRNLAKLYWEQVLVPRVAARLNADLLWVPYWAAPLIQPCPTVVTIHDLIPSLLPAYRGALLQRVYTALVSMTARRCARVITVSEASARDIVSHLGIAPSSVHAVHHGPNLAHAGPPPTEELEAIRIRYDLPPRYFLYLGGFDVRKNVQSVLAAYRLYLDSHGSEDIALVIAGALPQEESAFMPDPRRLAREAGLDGAVHFCGWVSEEDKPGVYALATAYLFPSLYEGFGMTVVEAMSAGTPVVTSDR